MDWYQSDYKSSIFKSMFHLPLYKTIANGPVTHQTQSFLLHIWGDKNLQIYFTYEIRNVLLHFFFSTQFSECFIQHNWKLILTVWFLFYFFFLALHSSLSCILQGQYVTNQCLVVKVWSFIILNHYYYFRKLQWPSQHCRRHTNIPCSRKY